MKIQSRKFQVWLVTVIIVIVSIIITNTIIPEIINMFTVISCIYIGGNVATKAIFKEK